MLKDNLELALRTNMMIMHAQDWQLLVQQDAHVFALACMLIKSRRVDIQGTAYNEPTHVSVKRHILGCRMSMNLWIVYYVYYSDIFK